MASKHFGIARLWKLMALAVVAIVLHPQLVAGQDQLPSSKPEVFVYPHPLTSKDKLADGTQAAIEIEAESTLIWVDWMPDARYTHPTEYILISAEGTRVVKGGWWPVLNGKPLFRGGKTYQVEFPIKLNGSPEAQPAEAKVDADRLRGMKAALADIEAGKLKIKSAALPDAAWHDSYLDLLQKKCGVEWETVAEYTGRAGIEVKGYNDVMILEIEHRFGKGILEKLQKKAEASFRATLDAK